MRNDRALFRDTALAVVLAAGSLALFVFYDAAAWLAQQGQPTDGVRSPDLLGGVLVVLTAAPVAVRRRWPMGALVASAVPDTLINTLGYSVGLTSVAGLVLIYSVAARRGLAVALGALLFTLLAYATGAMFSSFTSFTWADHLVVVILLSGAWGVGRAIRLRRAYFEELKDRAARLERAREADTRAARAEERSRIARELHDVIAHHVSVMTVQAAAARKVLTADPELAEEALSAIEHIGRKAMAEMRDIVGVLRAGSPAELGPQPGMSALPALVEQMREAGLITRLTVEGDAISVPAGIDLAAYRLVQEGLTNSLRHAGPGAEAVVTVRHEPRELDVRVEDDGRGAAGVSARAGHGLVGIRERVALYGGILSIGPRPGGGFEVRARFPLKDGR
ncbi:sensor histidine kinase [Nonomuraea typhae]|uniref:sensor histidine kinase n=1 Tax=Nonomuraea typhae TaxID=2603600 RepID=UPI001FE559A1|nr:sensor histidine kinase [Nonomuraea typhae]